jgi:Flp pilus assembly protein TadD
LIDALLDETTATLRRVVQGREEPAEKALPPERIAKLPNEPFSTERLAEHIHELRLLHAGVLTDAGQYRQAEDELQGWLDEAASPEERISYLFQLAQCRRAQGHEAGATEHLARALTLRPGDVRLNNDVAYGWIDQGVRLEEAERMIRYSLSRTPRQAAYLDTYGWLLYKKGAFAEAEKWLSRARSTRVNDPVVFDHLGDACWRLGRREEALRYWESAMEAEKKRPADRTVSGDEQRVREKTPKKIEDVRAGGEPAVAPVAEAP